MSSQNLFASQDTARLTRDKAKKAEYDKFIYVAKVNDLQKLNADLAKESADTKGKVATINKAEVQIKHNDPTPIAVQTEVQDSIITSTFKLDTTYSKGNYSKIEGKLTFDAKTKLSCRFR